MANEVETANNLSTLFPKTSEDFKCQNSYRQKLEEPRELYSTASLQHPPRWPVECQVIPETIRHIDTAPDKPEPFYISSNTEPQPRPVGEEMGTVIFLYKPKLSVDYFCRSTVNGSEEIDMCETDANTLKFESRFESGNLEKVIKVTNVYYELYLRPDMYTDRHAQWYYFRIQNTKENVLYRFSIVNLNKPDSLYRYGLKPLVYSEKEALINHVGWVRSGQNISYYKNDVMAEESNSSYTLTFNLKFSYNNDTVFIAQCYPYTYSKLQSYLQDIETDKWKSRLCQQRLLCKSLAGNNVYLLTITSSSIDVENECYDKKPVVVLTARVHPGETPSSYMMKGVIDFLTSDCPQANELRERFIFKLIPMLNPDGVICGNSRCCLLGQDLNRQYRTVLREAFPQIYHTKVLLRRLAEDNGIFLYCDIHGHSRRNNAFIYGCENRRIPERRLTEQIFPLMFHKNAADKFSFQNCKFKIHKSKEGTGRIFVWTLGVANSYTMEISLCGSTLASRPSTHFNTSDYENLGKHFCETLLDYSDADPMKEKIRDKMLKKLLERGSTAEEPVNIPITDYSSLSHSDTEDEDESDTTEDDDEIDIQKTKASLKRQVSNRNAKLKNRKPIPKLKSKSALVKHKKKCNSPTSEEAFLLESNYTLRKLDESDLRKDYSFPTKLNVFRRTRLMLTKKYKTQTEFPNSIPSTKKFTSLLFHDPFNPPNMNVPTLDQHFMEDTGTQTEDECDHDDSDVKNHFYLTTSSATSILSEELQFLSIGSRSKKESPQNSNQEANVVQNKQKNITLHSKKRSNSTPDLKSSRKTSMIKIKEQRSHDEMRRRKHSIANISLTNFPLPCPAQSSRKHSHPGAIGTPKLITKTRRVSWNGLSTSTTKVLIPTIKVTEEFRNRTTQMPGEGFKKISIQKSSEGVKNLSIRKVDEECVKASIRKSNAESKNLLIKKSGKKSTLIEKADKINYTTRNPVTATSSNDLIGQTGTLKPRRLKNTRKSSIN